MNEIEFVKECGIDVAKRTLSNAIGFGCSKVELFGGKYIFRTDDLKQIVDAWGLVEKFGGLNESRKYVDNGILPELSRAINLVEQCNA